MQVLIHRVWTGPAFCISNQLSGAAAATGPQTMLGVARMQRVKHIQAASWCDCAWDAGESRFVWNHDIALPGTVDICHSSGYWPSHPLPEKLRTSAVPVCCLFLVFFSQASLSPLLLRKAKRAGRGDLPPSLTPALRIKLFYWVIPATVSSYFLRKKKEECQASRVNQEKKI